LTVAVADARFERLFSVQNCDEAIKQ
jgi:hypothetical protein